MFPNEIEFAESGRVGVCRHPDEWLDAFPIADDAKVSIA
jgi:hypothetical protein